MYFISYGRFRYKEAAFDTADFVFSLIDIM